MSNVIALHAPRQGKGNEPDAIFLTKVIAVGHPAKLRKLRAHLWMLRPKERDGRYGVVGRQLLHLVGWTTCHATADTMKVSLERWTNPVDGDIVQLKAWPYDVSSWPPVALRDAPSPWHMQRDSLEGIANDAR